MVDPACDSLSNECKILLADSNRRKISNFSDLNWISERFTFPRVIPSDEDIAIEHLNKILTVDQGRVIRLKLILVPYNLMKKDPKCNESILKHLSAKFCSSEDRFGVSLTFLRANQKIVKEKLAKGMFMRLSYEFKMNNIVPESESGLDNCFFRQTCFSY